MGPLDSSAENDRDRLTLEPSPSVKPSSWNKTAKKRTLVFERVRRWARRLHGEVAPILNLWTRAPRPSVTEVRWAALLIMAVTSYGWWRAQAPTLDGERKAPPRSLLCKKYIQIGGPTGPVVCLGAGSEALVRAGVPSSCLATFKHRRRRRHQGLRSGHRVTIGPGCELRVSRMSPELLNTLQIKLDLNEATVEELMSLPGVGRRTAGRIVSFREARGRFRALEGLLEIEGIGPATLARLRRRLTCKSGAMESSQ